MADDCDALVVGAGVIGVSTAYALARRGLGVTIVDGAHEPGRGTSFANGAQLSYAYTDALGSPELVRNLPMLALGRDPAFRLQLDIDPDFLRWGLAFLRNCTASRFRSNTLEGLKLGLESRLAMQDLLALHPMEFGHVKAGKFHLIDRSDALAAARRLVEMKCRAGATQIVLGPDEAARMEPALNHRAKSLAGVVYSPDEEVGDPYRFSLALAEQLRAHYRVTTRFGTYVKKLDLTRDRPAVVLANGERIDAKTIVVCTGVETPNMLRGSGIRVPIWPMKGYSVTAPLGPEAPKASITDVARKVVFCRLSGEIRMAGLADLGNFDSRVDPQRLSVLIEASKASLPSAADYDNIRLSWAGLRPMTPSSLPVIRREHNGVVLNVGHGTLGWTYAMGAAERATKLMVAQA